MSETEQQKYLEAAIDMLPDTPEEIRAFLINQGIRPPYSVCPIARWIRKWVGEEISVSEYSIKTISFDNIARVRTPKHVAEFITAYDAGELNYE